METTHLQDLKQRLPSLWSAETTSDAQRWTPLNPASGQCAVTALVVNDQLGGEIVWAEALLPDGAAVSHYFNVVDSEVIDLTLDQFPAGTIISAGAPKCKGFGSTREYVLSFEATRKRYELLSSAFRRT